MSISINKLMNLSMGEEMTNSKDFGSKELPDKVKSSEGQRKLTMSQYYNSVKGNRMPKNIGNILQLGTPDGSNAAPGNKTVQIPNFSRPDGAIDPNRIRELSDPTTAQPYSYGGYGLEGGVQFGIPKSATTSSNSIGLIRKAQESYQSRQSILQPRAPPPPPQSAPPRVSPPSYDEATGDIEAYKKSNIDSELNETYK